MASKFEININSIEETLQSIGGAPRKTQEKDTRQFRPTIKNENKEYRAVVRFLPQVLPNGKVSKPYVVERWTHSFQENDQWYFENCPSLLNKQTGRRESKCPVCAQNKLDYDSNQEVLINRAKGRRVKKSYATNILVIEDSQVPENNGKVMYWNMPVEIYKLIEGKWKPESKRKSPSNPYCPINGYALELVLKFNPASGYPTYSGSEFLETEPLAETDDEIVEIIGRAIDLDEFNGHSIYKSDEELHKRFVKVTSGGIIVDSSSFGATTIFAEDMKPTERIVSSISTKEPEPTKEPATRRRASAVAETPAPVVAAVAAAQVVNDDWLDD